MTSSIAHFVDDMIQPVATGLSNIVFYKVSILGAAVPLIVIWLICAAIFFTFYFRFINIRGFLHSLALVRGDYSNPNNHGEVSHFQALSTAISGTVGLGNLGGVAVAISIGGPGATIWMMLSGFFGMTTKFVECSLGVKYRAEFPDKTVSGGPMYYLDRGLRDFGWPKLGKALGIFYALAIVLGCLGIGNMFQSNQAYEQLISTTGGDASFFINKSWLVGGALAVLVALVIIGGIKRIALVAEIVVPFMAALYILGALYIIGTHADKIPDAFVQIYNGAFTAKGVAGGVLGAMIAGMQRATFSNEAGIGSASIAHSAVKTNEPLTEGFVSLLEPFIDTIIICTITALVINVTIYSPEIAKEGLTGIQMTSNAFESTISFGAEFLCLAVFLFAFSTMIAWAYYGLQGWTYLFGHEKKSDIIFKTGFCLFVALGCMLKLPAVLAISDALIFIIALPNIIGLILLAPSLKRDLKAYQARIKSGEIPNYRKIRAKP